MPSIPHARNALRVKHGSLIPDFAPLVKAATFPYALIPDLLAATRRATRVPAQAQFNRPLPGVHELQCPACGALTAGPRSGWTPACYDAEGYLRPLRLAIPLSTLCRPCTALDLRLRGAKGELRRRNLSDGQYQQMRRYLYRVAGVAV